MTDVLIVDDEEDICDYLKDILEHMSLGCRFVLTGEDALKIIGKEPFKVYLVDMKLSTAVTGLEVIKEIRVRIPHAVIVAMTGYVDQTLKQETERQGVSVYLEKPADLNIDTFTDKIKALLSDANLRKDLNNYQP